MSFRLVSASLTDGGRGLDLLVLTDPVLDDDPVSLQNPEDAESHMASKGNVPRPVLLTSASPNPLF